jgi:hypothetical protein
MLFFLMGMLNILGVFKIGQIARMNNLKVKRKWLFIDKRDFKKQLEKQTDIKGIKEFKIALILINLSKVLFLLFVILFILSIE